MNTASTLPLARLQSASRRARFNPVRNLNAENLARILDAFSVGHLQQAAVLFEQIERRDDLLQGLIAKRKKSIARLDWEILTLDDSPEAAAHAEALRYFYNNLTATHALDRNQSGGLSLLIKQMMDAVGKRYAVHEVVYQPGPSAASPLTATFHFVPLWHFEHKDGCLHFLDTNGSASQPLPAQAWLVTTGEGLMESSAIAYLFKQLPLRDWLIYCERNGMPGVRGVTDAPIDSPEWNAAREAVRDFGAEFHALMSRGTEIEPIDLSSTGKLPYPSLIERMDRALIALWRGSDLATLARENGTGASVQSGESQLIEADDAANISETLNAQIDRLVLRHRFGVERGKAYFRLKPGPHRDAGSELEIIRGLRELGLEISEAYLRERFGVPA
ncbi:MAG: DUF935 family protein [Opitutales bacterium]